MKLGVTESFDASLKQPNESSNLPATTQRKKAELNTTTEDVAAVTKWRQRRQNQRVRQRTATEPQGAAAHSEHRGPPPPGNGGTVPGKYAWTQILSEVVVTVPVPDHTRGRDLRVEISKAHLKVALRSALDHEAIIDAPLSKRSSVTTRFGPSKMATDSSSTCRKSTLWNGGTASVSVTLRLTCARFNQKAPRSIRSKSHFLVASMHTQYALFYVSTHLFFIAVCCFCDNILSGNLDGETRKRWKR